MKGFTVKALAAGVVILGVWVCLSGMQWPAASAQADAPAVEAGNASVAPPPGSQPGTWIRSSGRFKVVVTYADTNQDAWSVVTEYGVQENWIYIRLDQKPGRFGVEEIYLPRENVKKVQVWRDLGESASAER